MSHETLPRLLYFGPADATASIKRVATEADLVKWKAAGWRTTRAIPESDAPQSDASDSHPEPLPSQPIRRGR